MNKFVLTTSKCVCLLLLWQSVYTSTIFAYERDDAKKAFDGASAELAAGLVLEKLPEEIINIKSAEENLKSEFLSNPDKYIRRDEASDKGRLFYKDLVCAEYKERAIKILDRLAAPRDRKDVFKEEFLNETLNPDDNLLEEIVSNGFVNAFNNARRDACEEQKKNIVSKIYPTVLEYDSLEKPRLIELLTDRISKEQSNPIFEENYDYIKQQLVMPILDEAEIQKHQQEDVLKKSDVAECAPSHISKSLSKKLLEFVQNKKLDSSAYAYDVFPSVTNTTLKTVAEQKSIKVFTSSLKEENLVISKDWVKDQIYLNQELHKEYKRSIHALRGILMDQFFVSELSRCDSYVNSSEIEEFKNFILSQKWNKTLDKRVREIVEYKLKQELPRIRDEISKEQFMSFFPVMAKYGWFPDAGLVEQVCKSHNPLEQVRTRSVELPLTELSPRNYVFMEETERELNSRLERVFEVGIKAKLEQEKLVDKKYEEVKTFFAENISSIDLGQIVEYYTSLVGESWQADRESVFSNYDFIPQEQIDRLYVELFPSVIEKIRLKSKDLFEELIKQEEKVEEQQPQNTETPEELELVEMNCVIIYERVGNDIKVTVEVDDMFAGEYKCEYTYDAYKKSADTFTKDVAEALMRQLKNKLENGQVELTLSLVVKDDFIYYGAVSKVFAILKKNIDALGEQIKSFDYTF